MWRFRQRMGGGCVAANVELEEPVKLEAMHVITSRARNVNAGDEHTM